MHQNANIASNLVPMATVVITTPAEYAEVLAFLRDGVFPVGFTRTQQRALMRKCAHLELHDETLYFKRSDNVLLRYYAAHQAAEKAEAIMERHLELACVRRDKLLFDLKDRIYCVCRSEVESVLETCTRCLFRVRMRTRQPARAIVTAEVAERYQADLVDLRYYASANDGYCWLLNVIDVYSKYLMSVPLLNKSAAVVCAGSRAYLVCLASLWSFKQTTGASSETRPLQRIWTLCLCAGFMAGRVIRSQTAKSSAATRR